MFERLRGIFGGQPAPPQANLPLYGLEPEERARIGTDDDPLRGFDAAMRRNEEAEKAERNGDPDKAITLYQRSVAENFVGSHPYEKLATLLERRGDHAGALRASEAYLQLAASGTMPRGAQRRADRKVPEVQARVARYRRET